MGVQGRGVVKGGGAQISDQDQRVIRRSDVRIMFLLSYFLTDLGGDRLTLDGT